MAPPDRPALKRLSAFGYLRVVGPITCPITVFLLVLVLVFAPRALPAQGGRQGAPSEQAVAEALRQARAVGDSAGLLAALQRLETLHCANARYTLALPLAIERLQLLEAGLGPVAPAVADQLNTVGELQRRAGQLFEALATHRRSHALRQGLYGDRQIEVSVSATNLGLTTLELGRHGEALELFTLGLSICEQRLPPGDLGIANALNNLAEYHRQTGAAERALPLYERSLSIVEARLGAENPIAALLHGNISAVNLGLYQLDRALAAASRSVAIREKLNPTPHPDLAEGWSMLAEVYRELGDRPRTRQLLDRALAMYEQTLGADHPSVARALNNLAGFIADQAQGAEAIPLYERSLAVVSGHLGAEHPSVAPPLDSLGATLQSLDRHEEAVLAHRRSLSIREQAFGRTHPEVAVSRLNLAIASIGLGKLADARIELHRSLSIILVHPGRQDLLWRVQDTISRLHAAQGQSDLAIPWGKEAVNTLQRLRSTLQTLDPRHQASFVEERQAAYRHLADLLIGQGRFAEAREVLQMLKEHQLHAALERSGASDPRSTSAELTGLEASRFARYHELRDQLAVMARQRQELEQRESAGPLSPDDARALAQIRDRSMPDAQAAVSVLLDRLESDTRASPSRGTPAPRQEASRLARAVDQLARSEPDASAVGLQYLLTDQRLSVILTLPGSAPIAYQRAIDRKVVYDRITEALMQVQTPSVDPTVGSRALRELHEWLIAPVAKDLERFGARTLMLSLDDKLRLLPFAALIDPHGRYVVERYTVSLFNEAARQALERRGRPAWRIAAMGLSEPVDDLPALPSVPDEIRSVVESAGRAGATYLNAEFDRSRLLGSLNEDFDVLHIASHFVFVNGKPAQSRLYLGDKTRMTLADITREGLRFDRLELVTLSACDTARGGGQYADGNELESLGARTQNQGAQAVLAALWRVSDSSTSAFMKAFYDFRNRAGLNKTAALRAAQLQMISGTKDRADRRAPYHWAAFVLMGNWR